MASVFKTTIATVFDQGTLFAILMGLINAGSSISSFLGGVLAKRLGVTCDKSDTSICDFSRLGLLLGIWYAVVVYICHRTFHVLFLMIYQ